MSEYPSPRPSSSNEKIMESVQDLPNRKSRLVRKTPLKARSIPKPIQKRKVPIQTHFTELFSNETTQNEHLEVKDVHETSNRPSFDYQDTGPRSISQDPVEDIGLNRDTNDYKIETLNWESKDVHETSNSRPSLDCQDTDTGSAEQDPIQDKVPNRDTTGPEIETLNWESEEVYKTLNSPSFNCQDTDTGSTVQDPIEDTGPNRDTEDYETESLGLHEDVNGNSESNVEHGFFSEGDAQVDIADASPENNTQLGISESFVLEFLDLLSDERFNKEESVSLDQARDILKEELEYDIKQYFKTTPVHLLMPTSEELAYLKEGKEQMLQEMLECLQKLSEIVKKFRLVPGRFSGDYENESWNAEVYERKRQEESDDNRYSLTTFLANFLLFSAILLIFILPAIVFQGFDGSNANGYIHAVVSWFNSDGVCVWQPVREWLRSYWGLV